jgi:hypothetical protein
MLGLVRSVVAIAHIAKQIDFLLVGVFNENKKLARS